MRRLTDNEKNIGPITYGRSSFNAIRLVWSSEGDDDGCHDPKAWNSLTGYAFGWVAKINMPRIIKPFLIKHVPTSWDAETIARLGRDHYYEAFPNEYGFSLSDGFFQLFLGPQTHDSLTTKSWSKFLPWTQWRFIRQSWYGKNGEHIQTLWESSSREVKRAQCDWRYEFEKTLAKTSFQIKDYDGKVITVDTNIEEREWRFGEGWFKWLSWFHKPMIRRVLNLSFREEVGTEKGSWKGGLMGTSIDMLPYELHESALRRYCEQEHRAKHGKYRITFIGAAV